jgi:hypothetical protein
VIPFQCLSLYLHHLFGSLIPVCVSVSFCFKFCHKPVNSLFSLAKGIVVQVKKKLMNLGHAQRLVPTYS